MNTKTGEIKEMTAEEVRAANGPMPAKAKLPEWLALTAEEEMKLRSMDRRERREWLRQNKKALLRRAQEAGEQ